MPSELLFDPSTLDLDRAVISREEILEANPQRFEFQQLDHVCHLDQDAGIIVGVRDIRDDEFWVRGHMPGRPIFPGVLMLECAAQVAGVYSARVVDTSRVIHGFGGADGVRFRRMLVPGDRLVIVAKSEGVTTRRSRYRCQGLIEESLAFEGTLLGVALPGR